MQPGLGQLGFWTALISLGASVIGGKKAKKEAKKQAAYQSSVDAISSGQAVAAPSVMTPADIATLRRVWPIVRQANHFALINWKQIGADISPAAKAALAPIWGVVNDAANFQDVNWNFHAVPMDAVAAVLPVPELPTHLQPAPVAPVYPSPYLTDPQGRTLIDARTGQPISTNVLQAGLFGGDIPQEYLVAGGVGLALLLLLSQQR
jgi:hypothetical protein